MIKCIKLILVILCMSMIFIFSSDSAYESTKKSDGVIVKTVEFFIGRNLTNKEKEKYIDKFVFIVRKGAHFSIYLILGFLICNYLIEYNIIKNKRVILALIICFLYAVSDEVHQLFVPGRSCEIRDILIDTSGSLVGIYIHTFIMSIIFKFKLKHMVIE